MFTPSAILPLLLLFSHAQAHAVSINRITETRLRINVSENILNADSERPLEFLNYLKMCGFEGELVEAVNPAQGNQPDLTGVHFLLRSVNLSARCYSKEWKLMNNPEVRYRLKQIAASGRLVFFALQTVSHFHSVVFDPMENEFASLLMQELGFEAFPELTLFFGPQALEGDSQGALLSENVLEISSIPLPASSALQILGLMSHLPAKDGSLHLKPGGKNAEHVRGEILRNLPVIFKGLSLYKEAADNLMAIFRGYLEKEEMNVMSAFFMLKCEANLSPRFYH